MPHWLSSVVKQSRLVFCSVVVGLAGLQSVCVAWCCGSCPLWLVVSSCLLSGVTSLAGLVSLPLCGSAVWRVFGFGPCVLYPCPTSRSKGRAARGRF